MGNRGPLTAHILFTSNHGWKGRIINLMVCDEGSSRYIPGLAPFATQSKYYTKDQLRRHPKIIKFLKWVREVNKGRGYPIQCVFWEERNN